MDRERCGEQVKAGGGRWEGPGEGLEPAGPASITQGERERERGGGGNLTE